MQQKQFRSFAVDIDADRYPEYWSRFSLFCKQLTGHRCCYPGCQNSKENGDQIETHHVIYGRQAESGLWLPIEQYIPGLMAVTLCDLHHNHRQHPECAHHPKNWVAGTRVNQYRDARNTETYHLLLLQGWHEKLLERYRK